MGRDGCEVRRLNVVRRFPPCNADANLLALEAPECHFFKQSHVLRGKCMLFCTLNGLKQTF